MANDDKKTSAMNITSATTPPVPVHRCIVYVRKNEDGTLDGRVANLANIEASGASERDVLGKLSRAFKARLMETVESGNEVELIDPPLQQHPNEQVRSIPVHL